MAGNLFEPKYTDEELLHVTTGDYTSEGGLVAHRPEQVKSKRNVLHAVV